MQDVPANAPPKPEPDTKPLSPARAHQEALKRLPTEIGGQAGLEPTRFGDWEKNGRCTDF
jgi:hypothetical protein